MLLHTRRPATLTRSWRLFLSFFKKQTSPADFYLPLARDTAALVTALHRDCGLSSPTLLVCIGNRSESVFLGVESGVLEAGKRWDGGSPRAVGLRCGDCSVK